MQYLRKTAQRSEADRSIFRIGSSPEKFVHNRLDLPTRGDYSEYIMFTNPSPALIQRYRC